MSDYSPASRISAAEACALKDKQPDTLFLDVRLEDDYAAAHFDGALNNCVFEVAFQERLAEQVPDKSTPVVLCGNGLPSRETTMAAEKLARAGYSRIFELSDGINVCGGTGLNLIHGPPVPQPPAVADGRHAFDPAECRVEWTGRNLLNKHSGQIGIASGYLDFTDGLPTGGEIVLDLRRIECTDLAGSPMHDVLIAHLESDDFFDTARHPLATLRVLGTEALEAATPGAPNVRVRASLSLRGVTEAIDFTAAAGLTAEGRPAAQAAFSIDRTRWGVLYGSGKFFARLAGHLVNDLIDLQVRVVCEA